MYHRPLRGVGKGLLWSGCTTYWILAAHHSAGPHAFLHTGSTANQPVPLKGLVILNVLRELRQRVSRCGAFRATEERHGGVGNKSVNEVE